MHAFFTVHASSSKGGGLSSWQSNTHANILLEHLFIFLDHNSSVLFLGRCSPLWGSNISFKSYSSLSDLFFNTFFWVSTEGEATITGLIPHSALSSTTLRPVRSANCWCVSCKERKRKKMSKLKFTTVQFGFSLIYGVYQLNIFNSRPTSPDSQTEHQSTNGI